MTDSTTISQNQENEAADSPLRLFQLPSSNMSTTKDAPPLRIPTSTESTYEGDRFIPMRATETNYEMQYQHEETLLRICHTQKRKSKNRAMLSPQSPSSLDDGEPESSSSPASSESKGSKGSPNEEKNKQIYKNLLAQ